MRSRFSLALAALLGCLASPLAAQVSGPAATSPNGQPPQYYPLYGGTLGIAVPAGRLGDEHAAGYHLGGLVEWAVPNQAYALRAEAAFQRFALKSGRTAGDDVSLFSIGPTILYQVQQTPAQTYLLGGIAIYNATGEGARPGFNLGGGIGFPLSGFSAIGEIRLHVMLADRKPILALPLSVGVRF
jgi:hypothetical protein